MAKIIAMDTTIDYGLNVEIASRGLLIAIKTS